MLKTFLDFLDAKHTIPIEVLKVIIVAILATIIPGLLASTGDAICKKEN